MWRRSDGRSAASFRAHSDTIYPGNITVEKTSSKNPKPETVRNIQEQKQLWIDLAYETSGTSTVSIVLSDWNEC